ncbi:PD-(D/E)XK nuclease family protein [Nocardiopsis dassonvillei]|uniref:PD-(D/E)XK nuclease family protein n=1 Tax=Nocardiopsis dassonvillei TaxID=2014 RepID=UPI00200E2B40|nr:PD-(D/E)XK nuclease family protein [Nocardiopsis dassonvillei]MCK9869404.1 PD-(D/E)XK nuclease family protein [Nocardiopsis dassonvillei]
MYKRRCPARAHFRALGLPADPGAEPARLRRERAVRAWLERLHRRLPRRPCTAGDLPGDHSSWSAGRWRLEGGQARLGAAMIAAHVGVCPLRGLASGSHVRVGHRLAADDTRADVLVLARADVLHHRGRSWVYRAVTTTDDAPASGEGTPSSDDGALFPAGDTLLGDGGTGPASGGRHFPDGNALLGDEEALLAAEPRLALAVGLFACGALPAGPDSAVELEVLGPRGASVRSLDPGSARVRATARRVVRELAGPWHGDTSHLPAPGEGCLDCPYRRWCPATGLPGALHGPGARARDRRGGAAPGPVRDPPPGQAAGSPSSAKR